MDDDLAGRRNLKPDVVKVGNVGGGAAPGDVESMRKDLDKILGRDEHGTAQVSGVVIMPQMIFSTEWERKGVRCSVLIVDDKLNTLHISPF